MGARFGSTVSAQQVIKADDIVDTGNGKNNKSRREIFARICLLSAAIGSYFQRVDFKLWILTYDQPFRYAK
jgi:hypothetical protein